MPRQCPNCGLYYEGFTPRECPYGERGIPHADCVFKKSGIHALLKLAARGKLTLEDVKALPKEAKHDFVRAMALLKARQEGQ